MAACHSVDPDRWQAGFDELMGRIAWSVRAGGTAAAGRGVPARVAGRVCRGRTAGRSPSTPARRRRTGCSTCWRGRSGTPTRVRDDLRGYVVDHLGDPGAVLVVDETGDLKKGAHTVGVQRQYTGTAGRIENAQVAVYLAYAAPAGHAFIDRALYLPRSWTDDPDRCAAAGVPDEVGFATKPALAAAMIARALDAGTPASWVAGDEVYGDDPRLRADLQDRGIGYVLAVASDHRVTHRDRRVRSADRPGRRLPGQAWQRLSAGAGAKGHRFYDWAWIDIDRPPATPGHHWLLIRRNRRTGELAFYRATHPTRCRCPTLVRVAGRRWTIEESFQTGKGLTGLDQHQVRRWTSWHRWTILAMLAHAFLAVITAAERADNPAPNTDSSR